MKVKDFGWKTLSIAQALIIVIVLIVSWSPKSHYPSLVQSGTLDFPNTTAGLSSDLTMTVTGAVLGDCVLVGPADASVSSNGCYMGWVSATNTVSVRYLNNSLLAGVNPTSGVFKILVFK